MLSPLRDRYRNVIASVYIHNEYQAYTGLERFLMAVQEKYPLELEFLDAVRNHVADERKHYRLFKQYFQAEGVTPFKVDRTFGYVDRLVHIVFSRQLEDLNVAEIVGNEARLLQLCRLIMLTEFRGMKQVDHMLRSRSIQRDHQLLKVFRVIESDEPSHCLPYQHWLRSRNSAVPGIREQVTDFWVHYSLVILKLPMLFLNPGLQRRMAFQDEG